MGQHDQEEHKETPGTLGCSCIGLYLALTRLNRTFPSVFRLFQIIFQIIFASFVRTQTAFFIKKQNALGGFQIFFR